MTPRSFVQTLKGSPFAIRLDGSRKKVAAYLGFRQDFKAFRALSRPRKQRFSLAWEHCYPCLEDKTSTTGFDRHYVYHPAWAARVLAQTKPASHIDISSTVHFCSMISTFMPVKFYDYRPADLRLSGLECEAADLMALPFDDNSIQSLSCMHVVEHIGLGRYGDPLDPDGDLKAIAELKRVLAVGGTLLFVVPMGQRKIMFNAHRLYTFEQVKSYFDGFHLRQFVLIPQDGRDGGLVEDPDPQLLAIQTYGCGCFWIEKAQEDAGESMRK